MTIDVRPVQPKKASLAIDVTEFGISIEVKPDLQKTWSPIYVTEFGISTEVKLVQ